jgi:AcrR family transcriptional regulator
MSSSSVRTTGMTRVERKAETRSALLGAAYELFTEQSVVTTPMEEVAKAAGVSKATLFFHFGSRIELLEALAAQIYHQGVETVWHPKEPGLEPFLKAYLASQRVPGARLLWEIGDVLTVNGRPGPDVAYLHLASEIEARLAEDGFDPAARTHLARLLAPAALWVARRTTFDQADDDELQRFIADIQASLAPWRPADDGQDG